MRLQAKFFRVIPVVLLLFLLSGSSASTQNFGSSTTDDFAVSPAKRTPSPRADHAGVFDSNRNVYYIFGGADGNTYNNEMWRFKRGKWREVRSRTKTVPVPRSRHSMVYHEQTKSLLVFGGRNKDGSLGDFWQFKNRRWEKLPEGPIAREGAALAVSDYAPHHVYLYGGRSGNLYYNDFWRWDGEKWAVWNGFEWIDEIDDDVAIFHLRNPSGRAYHNMFIRGGILHMFGGEKPNGKVNTDMWSFRTETLGGWWQEPEYSKKYLNTDSGKGRVARIMKSPLAGDLIFGGYDGKRTLEDLVQLDIYSQPTGTGDYSTIFRWIFISDFNQMHPCKRAGHTFIWNDDKKEALLFGGWSDGVSMNDTWIYDYNDGSWEQIN